MALFALGGMRAGPSSRDRAGRGAGAGLGRGRGRGRGRGKPAGRGRGGHFKLDARVGSHAHDTAGENNQSWNDRNSVVSDRAERQRHQRKASASEGAAEWATGDNHSLTIPSRAMRRSSGSQASISLSAKNSHGTSQSSDMESPGSGAPLLLRKSLLHVSGLPASFSHAQAALLLRSAIETCAQQPAADAAEIAVVDVYRDTCKALVRPQSTAAALVRASRSNRGIAAPSKAGAEVEFITKGRNAPIQSKRVQCSVDAGTITIRKGNPGQLEGKRLAIARSVAASWDSTGDAEDLPDGVQRIEPPARELESRSGAASLPEASAGWDLHSEREPSHTPPAAQPSGVIDSTMGSRSAVGGAADALASLGIPPEFAASMQQAMKQQEAFEGAPDAADQEGASRMEETSDEQSGRDAGYEQAPQHQEQAGSVLKHRRTGGLKRRVEAQDWRGDDELEEGKAIWKSLENLQRAEGLWGRGMCGTLYSSDSKANRHTREGNNQLVPFEIPKDGIPLPQLPISGGSPVATSLGPGITVASFSDGGPLGWFKGRPTLKALAVVKHTRSASGDEGLDSHETEQVRPPSVLLRVCDYLFGVVIDADKQGHDPRFDGRPTLLEIHEFLFNRTRAVRKHLSTQGFKYGQRNDCIAMEILERCARYHILMQHELCDVSGFDQGLNLEQLSASLKAAIALYDDAWERHESCCRSAARTSSKAPARLRSPCEAEIRGFWLLLHASDARERVAVSLHLKQLRPELLRHPRILNAMWLYRCADCNDIASILRGLRSGSCEGRHLSYLERCLVHFTLREQRMRVLRSLQSFVAAKGSDAAGRGSGSISLGTAAKWLGIDERERPKARVKYLAEYHGVRLVRRGTGHVVWPEGKKRSQRFLPAGDGTPYEHQRGTFLVRPPDGVGPVGSDSGKSALDPCARARIVLGVTWAIQSIYVMPSFGVDSRGETIAVSGPERREIMDMLGGGGLLRGGSIWCGSLPQGYIVTRDLTEETVGAHEALPSPRRDRTPLYTATAQPLPAPFAQKTESLGSGSAGVGSVDPSAAQEPEQELEPQHKVDAEHDQQDLNTQGQTLATEVPAEVEPDTTDAMAAVQDPPSRVEDFSPTIPSASAHKPAGGGAGLWDVGHSTTSQEVASQSDKLEYPGSSVAEQSKRADVDIVDSGFPTAGFDLVTASTTPAPGSDFSLAPAGASASIEYPARVVDAEDQAGTLLGERVAERDYQASSPSGSQELGAASSTAQVSIDAVDSADTISRYPQHSIGAKRPRPCLSLMHQWHKPSINPDLRTSQWASSALHHRQQRDRTLAWDSSAARGGSSVAFRHETQAAAIGTVKVVQLHKLKAAFGAIKQACCDMRERRSAALRAPVGSLAGRSLSVRPMVRLGVASGSNKQHSPAPAVSPSHVAKRARIDTPITSDSMLELSRDRDTHGSARGVCQRAPGAVAASSRQLHTRWQLSNSGAYGSISTPAEKSGMGELLGRQSAAASQTVPDTQSSMFGADGSDESDADSEGLYDQLEQILLDMD